MSEKKKSFGPLKGLVSSPNFIGKTGDTVNKYIRGNGISPRESKEALRLVSVLIFL